MIKTSAAFACVAVFLCNSAANAHVTFDWAIVGNPGNDPDQDYGNGRFGAVAYTYRISKYEVTNAQYAEFLNAADPLGANPNSLYSPDMGSRVWGGIAFNAGAANGLKYSTKTDMGNKPVNFVSFMDAMRFTNWLENGQPTDGSGTETGVYKISDGLSEVRAMGAQFFIPSEDEWYKAAYHQPAAQGGDSDNYWLYPTATNSVPTIALATAVGDVSNPGMNVVNYRAGADWNGENGNVTTVGSAGPGSASFYGTFDQGGNLWELNESVIAFGAPCCRGLRGGDWTGGNSGATPGYNLAASFRHAGGPRSGNAVEGFRVASIPEPTAMWLAAWGCLGPMSRRILCRPSVMIGATL